MCVSACNWFRHENWSSFWPALPAPHSPDLNRHSLITDWPIEQEKEKEHKLCVGVWQAPEEGTMFDLHMRQLCSAAFAAPCGTFYFRLTDGFLFGHQNKQMLHATM